MAITTVSLSKAKAQLSSLIRMVEEENIQIIVEKRGAPVARIAPVAGYRPEDMFGLLSAFADTTKHEQESTAFASAMEAKHASHR